MTNEEKIDKQIEICMGWSGHPNEQPVRKDIEQIGPGILLLLAEIAKRLPVRPDLVPVWTGDDGKPVPIMNGPIMPGEPLPPIITGGNQIRMNLPLSRQNGPFWEDLSRLLKVLGYTYVVHRLEHEIRVTLTKEPPF